MSKVRQEKIISSLPATLTASTLYYVRVGTGFDLYLTNETGTLVAYKINGGSTNASVADYRSEFNNNGYIYSGYTLDGTPTIKRTKDGSTETAGNVSDLAVDWPNRLTLTYS